MTKKDYILIAAAVKAGTALWAAPEDRKDPDVATYLGAVSDVASAIADALERQNPRFDRTRFLTACGVA